MAKRPTYQGLFKVANELTLGKCECGREIKVELELSRPEEEEKEEEMSKKSYMDRALLNDAHREDDEMPEDEDEDGGHRKKEELDPEWEDVISKMNFDIPDEDEEEEEDSHSVQASNRNFEALVKKASTIVDRLDTVATQVEKQNPRLAARIDAVSNEIEKRVARLLQRRQNTK